MRGWRLFGYRLMRTYHVYGIATVSKYLGDVQADTPEEAEEKANEELSENMSFSLCHQCNRQFGDTPCIDHIEVEEVK